MKDLTHFTDRPSYRFDYCRFGFTYQKPTRIWSNKELKEMKCECKEKHKFRLGANSKDFRHKTFRGFVLRIFFKIRADLMVQNIYGTSIFFVI